MFEIKDYERDLKNNGLKSTKSRKAILNVLQKSKNPIDVEQIYQRLRENEVAVNLSTVYRALDTLHEKGLVSKLSIMNSERMLFEYNNIEHRHYLVCVDCQKIITISTCPLASYERMLESETNFKIDGHKLYLYGHCVDCQKK